MVHHGRLPVVDQLVLTKGVYNQRSLLYEELERVHSRILFG